jgi:hypothetical protein
MPARSLVVVHRSNTGVAGHDVSEWEIGTLLWPILDVAGETDIGNPVLLERAVGTRLTADTLPQVLQAGAFNGVVGSEFTVAFGPDQTLSLYEDGMRLTEGTWWMEDDNYCHQLPNEYGGRQCFQVVQNGSEIMLFDLGGYAALQTEAVSR